MPYIYRANVIGHVIELRMGDFGGQQLLVNGRVFNNWPFAGLTVRTHQVPLPDTKGKVRNVEVRVRSGGTFGLRYEMLVGVDGHLVAVVAPSSSKERPSRCAHCLYDLRGLEPSGGEVRCPECGRHTDAAALDLTPPPPPAPPPSA